MDDSDVDEDGNKVNKATAMITDGSVPPIVEDENDVDKDRKKRTKKEGANSTSLGSTSFLERLIR